MTKCPICDEYSMALDGYFSRFRCYKCGWMTPSSYEREMKLAEQQEQPVLLLKQYSADLDATITALYDSANDALVFNFGSEEPSVDIPEPDGILVWQVGCGTRRVTGFMIFRARERGTERVEINLDLRKKSIEAGALNYPDSLSPGRTSSVMIENIIVKALQTKAELHNGVPDGLRGIFGQAEGMLQLQPAHA